MKFEGGQGLEGVKGREINDQNILDENILDDKQTKEKSR